MAHEIVPAAEEILDKEFPVLDHGFVRLVDYLGGDQRIVQAARVSYGAGTKTYRQDKGLIDYLLRNEHTSPFEQVVLTFHTKMPVFVARQWVRHRTARLNEISGRYSVMKDEFYLPADDAIAPQAEDNKQGRAADGFDDLARKAIKDALAQQQTAAYDGYQRLLDYDLARELARINLPLSTYTEWYWQIDLHNLFHFLRLRMDHHAQYEIRVYAEQIFEITKLVCPIAVESFDEHLRGGVRFSRSELEVVHRLIDGGALHAVPEESAHNSNTVDLIERVRRAAEASGITGRAAERVVNKIVYRKMG